MDRQTDGRSPRHLPVPSASAGGETGGSLRHWVGVLVQVPEQARASAAVGGGQPSCPGGHGTSTAAGSWASPGPHPQSRHIEVVPWGPAALQGHGTSCTQQVPCCSGGSQCQMGTGTCSQGSRQTLCPPACHSQQDMVPQEVRAALQGNAVVWPCPDAAVQSAWGLQLVQRGLHWEQGGSIVPSAQHPGLGTAAHTSPSPGDAGTHTELRDRSQAAVAPAQGHHPGRAGQGPRQ